MPEQARLIIIGAGIVGCSAAYQLARLGWRDVLVLDKGPLFVNDGSTSHAPGGMFLTNSSRMMTELAKSSRQLYGDLQLDGLDLIFPVGGLEVAYTPERWHDLRRKQGFAKAYGLPSELISPAETKRLVPILDDKVIHGAFFTPRDAVAKGVRLMEALARAATAGGAVRFQGDTPVTGFQIEGGRVRGVTTPTGAIAAEQVLICANLWAPLLARQAGFAIPLMAAQHLYAVTAPIPELVGATREVAHPLMRHQDHAMYFRQHGDCYGVGSYRHAPLMVDPHDELGASAKLAFTPDHFAAGWESTVELLPPLRNAELVTRFNGMFAFTVDGYPVIGESPVKGLWACTGLWLTHAGGAAEQVAQWMTSGAPSIDLREADITRFHPHQATRAYIHERCAQNYREVYDIIHPREPYQRPRNLRLSPWHQRLAEQGARFTQSAGWETALWHEANAPLLERYGDSVPRREGWAAHFWSPIEGAEHLHVRERAGLFNLAALAVIEVSGPGAAAFLNRVAANQVDRPVGRLVYTSLLDQNGGIVADVTVVRVAPDRFWLTTGGGSLPHDLAWLQRHAPEDGSVAIADRSSSLVTLGLWGPRARTVLQRVAEQDVSNAAFPYYTARPLTVGAVPAYALRVSYAGELGWELYCPAELGLALWDTLWEAGRPDELIAAGGGAFDSLRLEKGYRLWGADIHTDYTPLEAGIGWAVRLDKGDFIGRDALIRQRELGLSRKLCCLRIDQPGAVLLGKEPILSGGEAVGYVTSANYGYSVGALIAYGYLPVALSHPGSAVTVEYFGEPLRAVVSEEPLFDRAMVRLKA
jgi:glycine cleavage system T protein